MNRALVIGGGVIGLSIAWQLLREGYSVFVFEKDLVESTTSWISGGMLCPYSEMKFLDDLVFHNGITSLALYPSFLRDLQTDSGQCIEMEGKGTLLVASNRDEYQQLQHSYQKLTEKTHKLKWLSGQEVKEKEPLLSDIIVGGVWIPQESQLNSRRLLHALVQAILKRGGVIHENVHVEQIWKRGNKALGIVLSNKEKIQGALTVIATGAWTKSLEAGKNLYPVKGQIITAIIPKTIQISHVVRTPYAYLVPKQDQTIKIGATMEDVGFNRETTVGGVQGLLREAWRVLPIVSEFTFLRAEAGLRSMTPQRIPIIQKEQIEGLYTATGHGRDGVLLAPYTAYSIVSLIKQK